MIEVLVRNRHGDWGFLHPWADYVLQEVWPTWKTEQERQELVKECEQIWGFRAESDNDLENYREIMIHRDHYQLIAHEERSEMGLETVIPVLTKRLGLKVFADEPERLWSHNGFHYTDFDLYKDACEKEKA